MWGMVVSIVIAISILLYGNSQVVGQTGVTFPFTRNQFVAQTIEGVQQSEVYSYTGYLSGEFPITVGQQSLKLSTRNSHSEFYTLKATQYVYEFMQAQKLTVSYEGWSSTAADLSSRNVVGVITGTVRPAEIVMVTAHLDDMPEGNRAPGADDNSSGSVGVMMAVAKLAGHQFERTIRFVFFTGEEYGLLGSAAYAKQCQARHENIVAVYNMDMIGWDGNNDGVVYLETRKKTDSGYQQDTAIVNLFKQVVNSYGISNLHPMQDANRDTEVDSISFWNAGYSSVTAIEDCGGAEQNPNYHTINDNLQSLNMPFFTGYVKASVGTVAHLATPLESLSPTPFKIYLPVILKP